VTDVEPGILNQVERFPDACWECGTKLRVARHRKRSQSPVTASAARRRPAP